MINTSKNRSKYHRVFQTTPELFYNWALNWYNEHAYGYSKKPYLKYEKTLDSFNQKVKIQRPVIESNELLGKTTIIYFDAIVTSGNNQEDPFPAFSFRVVPLNEEKVEVEILQNFDPYEIKVIKDAIWADVLTSFNIGKSVHLSKKVVKPKKPHPPKRGSSVVVWLDYYHAMKNANFKISFSILAEDSGYAANTFKQAHAQYKLERGID